MDMKHILSSPQGTWDLGELANKLQISICEADATHAIARMPIPGNRQPHGFLNGGASAALAETAASLSANIYANSLSPVHNALGAELAIKHIRPAREGSVTARALQVQCAGKKLQYEIEILGDSSNETLAKATLTCVLKPAN